MKEFDNMENPEITEIRKYREFAMQIAKDAGEYMLSRHGEVQKIEYKLRTDFKTDTDDNLDRLLREKIAQQYPGHSIYSEELPPEIKDSEYAWVYDPLDGTFNFTNGFLGMFSASIGLVKGREAIMGVVNVPSMGELFSAQKGEGAYMNNQRIKVSETVDVNKAMVAMDFGKLNRQRGVKYYNRMLAADGVRYPAVYACTSVSIMQVANGRLDAYISSSAEPWDYAGSVPIAREAGARVTTLEGKEWQLGDESMLVANPALHQKLSSMFSEVA